MFVLPNGNTPMCCVHVRVTNSDIVKMCVFVRILETTRLHCLFRLTVENNHLARCIDHFQLLPKLSKPFVGVTSNVNFQEIFSIFGERSPQWLQERTHFFQTYPGTTPRWTSRVMRIVCTEDWIPEVLYYDPK